jgi:hypothetical protein
MQDIGHDVPERQLVTVLHDMERVSNLGSRVQDVFGTCLAGESTPGGTMIGMDMGIDDKPDTHTSLVGDPQVWFDVAQRVHHGTGGVPAAAEQVGDRNGVGMEELTQDHSDLPGARSIGSLDRCLTVNQSTD